MANKDESLYVFLRERGISADSIQNMIRDKIDCMAVAAMTDDQLKQYVAVYGDRLAVNFFVNRKTDTGLSSESGQSKRKESLLERLRKKLKSDSVGGDSASNGRSSGKCFKESRVVQIGLILSGKGHVKPKDGGGVRQITMSKNATASQLLDTAKTVFFPDGSSKVGFSYDYDYKMLDFTESCVKETDTLTVEDMFLSAKMKTLRCYLQLTPISQEPFICESSSDSLPDLTEWPESLLQVRTEIGEQVLNSNTFQHHDADELQINSILSEQVVNVTQHTGNDTCQNLETLGPNLQCAEQTNCGATSFSDSFQCKSLEDVLRLLGDRAVLLDDGSHCNIVNVTRENVLDGGYRAVLRKSFNCNHRLSVKFAGEAAIDDGGPSREFLRIAIREIAGSNIFYGPEGKKFLSVEYAGLFNQAYEAAGRLLAYSMVHRGPLPSFMDPMMFQLLAETLDVSNCDIPFHAVPTTYMQSILEIEACDSRESFSLIMDKIMDLVEISGCGGFMRFESRKLLVNALERFIVVHRIQPALEQFRLGLGSDVVEMIRSYPDIMQSAFTDNPRHLDSTIVELLLEVPVESWSVKGSNRRTDEERVYAFFLDYLQDAEDLYGGDELKLLLQSVTGSDTVPVLGFQLSPRITFRHKVDTQLFDCVFPVANTCTNTIALPCAVQTYDVFKQRLHAAIQIDMFTTE